MTYLYKRQVNMDYISAVEKIKEELKKEGFGVITEIDVKATLKKKLNVDFDNYIILGACNPPFAYEALKAEKDIGIVMPCNVIVYEDKSSVYVAATLPTITMNVVGNPLLAEFAPQVETKLKKAVDNL